MLIYSQAGRLRKFFIPVCISFFLGSASCVHKTAASAPSAPALDNSYLDLTPGGSLRIVVPLLKSGALLPEVKPVQEEGNTLLVSTPNLAGYDISYYSIEPASHGRVRLKFTGAEVTREGKTLPDTQAPALPFRLPAAAQHVRLIYLIRKSQSDHNMAVVAAKNLDALSTFTKQLESRPDVCPSDNDIFCSWVPAGVAVRPESELPPKP